MDRIIYEICPNCSKQAESEGVNNGCGYVYPPFRCYYCGWSEQCELWDTDTCGDHCTEYEWCSKIN